MAFKKKKGAAPKPAPRPVKKAAPKPPPKPPPKPKGVPGTIYYRDGSDLYRVVSKDIDWGDLSETPKGDVSRWDGSSWAPGKMPAGVKHTKNTAGVGV